MRAEAPSACSSRRRLLIRPESRSAKPAITVGGRAAQYVSGVLKPGMAGIYEITIKLPGNVAAGDEPLKATIGGVSIPDGLFLNIGK